METIFRSYPESGLLHFWFTGNPDATLTDSRDSLLDKLVQELIINMPSTSSPTDDYLQDIDGDSPYAQELLTEYITQQSLPATLTTHIESKTKKNRLIAVCGYSCTKEESTFLCLET